MLFQVLNEAQSTNVVIMGTIFIYGRIGNVLLDLSST